MNILVISVNCWSDENSVGNTFSNWFSGYPSENIANVFMRNEQPHNSACQKYFRISDSMLIKNFFTPWKIGENFEYNTQESAVSQSEIIAEQKMKSILKTYKKSKFLYWMQDFLWSLGTWKNKNFRDFLQNFNPDIAICFGMPSVQYAKVLAYTRKVTGCKTAVFISDNVYGDFLSKRSLRTRFDDCQFRKILAVADKLYGASEELCNAYQSKFHRNITPLYKGADFTAKVKSRINNPIRIVYAGNLYCGRMPTLLSIAKELNNVNEEKICIELNVYSASSVTEQETAELVHCKGCHFKGKTSYDEVKKILSESDIVLHVESFEADQIEKVKYSFSTKIIDCMQSGSAILAVGPAEVASMAYWRRLDGAMTASNEEELRSIISEIANYPSKILERASAIRKFAEKNCSINVVRERLYADLAQLAEK